MGCCVVFLGKSLYFNSAPLNSGVLMCIGKLLRKSDGMLGGGGREVAL